MENTFLLADDGSRITASNSYEVVAQLRDSSRFAHGETLAEFMDGFAERYELQTGNHVSSNGSEAFVADLVKFGYLTKIATDGNG